MVNLLTYGIFVVQLRQNHFLYAFLLISLLQLYTIIFYENLMWFSKWSSGGSVQMVY